MKIFFEKLNTPFETLPFGQWEIADYLPAAKRAISLAYERVEELKNSSPDTFGSFLYPYLESSRELDLITGAFFNLHHSNTSDEMEQVAQELSPMLTQFSNDLLLDAELFQKVKGVYNTRDSQNLTIEEQTILEDQYKTFVRNGALLGEEDKQQLRKVDEKLAKLKLEFGKNALTVNNQFIRSVSEEDLVGIPKENWEIFQNAAQEKGLSGYAVTLDMPVYMAFMKGSENRSLREEVYIQFVQTATSGEYDNKNICTEIINLRRQRANILGYADHPAFVLERRMAQTSQEVMDFLQSLKEKAFPKAQDEMVQLSQFAKQRDSIEKFRPWDFNFYGEKYQKQLFNFDDEVLRPYFQLENVIEGAFEVAARLYNVSFKENSDIAQYHPEVKVYEVVDLKSSKVCGIFYTDFFPRSSKHRGAWCTYFRRQSQGKVPHVSIVCNFTKSTSTRPSLLTHREVSTLFHEFGHALHNLLSKCQYFALSGSQVYWDFVELPSQLMENWTFEKECLDLFAKHYQTGELIPASLVEKIKQSQSFLEGFATMRQLSLATLDMTLHTMDPEQIGDIIETERNIMKEFDLFHYRPANACMCTTFGHIFNGGYSAGYYSYKWAEVLDADAFELFKEKGIFDSQTAQSFRDHILAKGGTEHPMALYQRFRGRKPDISALLRRCGLS